MPSHPPIHSVKCSACALCASSCTKRRNGNLQTGLSGIVYGVDSDDSEPEMVNLLLSVVKARLVELLLAVVPTQTFDFRDGMAFQLPLVATALSRSCCAPFSMSVCSSLFAWQAVQCHDGPSTV